MSAVSFKCPNCDGELIFEPSTQKYKCEYCMSLFSQKELDAMSFAENLEQTDTIKDASAVAYSCPSCGAQIVTDETTAASFCYYCHNPVVLSGRLQGSYLPNLIIPFSVTREAAEQGFLDYICKKKFVPRAFYSKKQVERMTGVYFPYWHYNVSLAGKMQGDARKIRIWRSGNTEYTETKQYQVLREGDVELENLTENALKKANRKLANGVMPYDFKHVKKFYLGYLSGFFAERRDMEQETVAQQMQQEMRESAEKLMRETIKGYESVSIANTSLHAQKEIWSYTLLPVWTLTYQAKNGKIYYFSMNGQTGKVYGELPIDYGKVSAASAVVGAIVLALLLLGGYFI